MTQHLNELLQKEMTRKEFMATLALGVGSIMGFSSIIKLLTGKSLTHHGITSTRLGYGGSAYGGGKD
jgi:hypothetical protein